MIPIGVFAQKKRSGSGDVLSLINFNKPDGSTTFVDEVSGVTWTRYGNATIRSPDIFGGPVLSAGGSDLGYVKADLPSPILADEDFTFECIYRLNGTPDGYNRTIASILTDASRGYVTIMHWGDTTIHASYGYGYAGAGGNFPEHYTNQVVHFVLQRKAGVCAAWINGVKKTSTTNLIDCSFNAITVGHNSSMSWASGEDRYISSVRLSRGNVYDFYEDFTPPSGKLSL